MKPPPESGATVLVSWEALEEVSLRSMKTPFPCPAAPFLLAAALLLAGCASGPQAAKPTLLPAPAGLAASKVATITIYRPDYPYGTDIHPTVAVNGSDLVTPHRDTVFTARLLPGEYHFTVDDDKAGDLKASAGKHYYFQMVVVPSGFSGHGRLGIVSPEQGEYEIAHLEPIDKDDIENPAFR